MKKSGIKNWLAGSSAVLSALFILFVLLAFVSTQTAAAPDVIFSDNFERSGEINNNWIVTKPDAGVNNPRLSTAAVAKAAGTTKGVVFEGSSQTTAASIERTIDTSGYSNVEISYYRGLNGLDEGDTFAFEYEAPVGTALVLLESIAGIAGTGDDQNPTQVSFALPSNDSLLIRFRLDADVTGDQAGVDEIVVSGEPTSGVTPTLTPTLTPTPTPTEGVTPTPTVTIAPTPTITPPPVSYWSWFRQYMDRVFAHMRQTFDRIWSKPPLPDGDMPQVELN